MLSACASPPPAPVAERGQPKPDGLYLYRVQPGDTLYSIAWKHGLDYKRMAAANGIKSPYAIKAGQNLYLREAAVPASRPRSTAPRPQVAKPGNAARPVAVSKPAGNTVTPSSGRLRWQWPVKGRVIAGYSDRGRINKGIDIAGKPGDAVRSAAAGKVVYAGSGLKGYGKLLIIRHNNDYLSAYAHNQRLLVKEGQMVKAGAVIAELGASGTDRPKLHFEIRRQGKPLNPLKLLPPMG